MDNFFNFLSDLIKSGSISEFHTVFIVFIVLFMFRKQILKQVFDSDQNQKPQNQNDSQNCQAEILEKLDNIQKKVETIKDKLVSEDSRITNLETLMNQVTYQIKSEFLDLKKDLTKWNF